MNRFFVALGLFLGVFYCVSAVAGDGSVVDMRVGQHEDSVRLVVESTVKLEHNVFYLTDPYRVVVDLPAVDWQVSPKAGQVEKGFVKGFRFGLFTPQTSRIVVDSSQPIKAFRAFDLPPTSDNKNYRLVLDFKPVGAKEFTEQVLAAKQAYRPPKVTAQQLRTTDAPKRKKPVIVIDAGHGGVDPGAIGVTGTYEKKVTLKAAQRLKSRLEATGRYDVQLTRNTDTFLPLVERVNVARNHYADLFISLHADSHPKRSARGLSIYTLSETASDKEAARLAAKENKADLIAGVHLEEEPEDVSKILIDLTQRETMNLSARLAQGLVKQLGERVYVKKNTHRFAGFVVLKAPDIPSVLIELGYLSNRDDEKRLLGNSYLDKVSDGIVKGVDSYFSWKSKISSL